MTNLLKKLFCEHDYELIVQTDNTITARKSLAYDEHGNVKKYIENGLERTIYHMHEKVIGRTYTYVCKKCLKKKDIFVEGSNL